MTSGNFRRILPRLAICLIAIGYLALLVYQCSLVFKEMDARRDPAPVASSP